MRMRMLHRFAVNGVTVRAGSRLLFQRCRRWGLGRAYARGHPPSNRIIKNSGLTFVWFFFSLVRKLRVVRIGTATAHGRPRTGRPRRASVTCVCVGRGRVACARARGWLEAHVEAISLALSRCTSIDKEHTLKYLQMEAKTTHVAQRERRAHIRMRKW